MNGLQMASEIQEAYGPLPVLLASGYSSKQFIPVSDRKFPILRKPYTRQSVALGISQLIAK
jgi:hypothetical protein